MTRSELVYRLFELFYNVFQNSTNDAKWVWVKAGLEQVIAQKQPTVYRIDDLADLDLDYMLFTHRVTLYHAV